MNKNIKNYIKKGNINKIDSLFKTNKLKCSDESYYILRWCVIYGHYDLLKYLSHKPCFNPYIFDQVLIYSSIKHNHYDIFKFFITNYEFDLIKSSNEGWNIFEAFNYYTNNQDMRILELLLEQPLSEEYKEIFIHSFKSFFLESNYKAIKIFFEKDLITDSLLNILFHDFFYNDNYAVNQDIALDIIKLITEYFPINKFHVNYFEIFSLSIKNNLLNISNFLFEKYKEKLLYKYNQSELLIVLAENNHLEFLEHFTNIVDFDPLTIKQAIISSINWDEIDNSMFLINEFIKDKEFFSEIFNNIVLNKKKTLFDIYINSKLLDITYNNKEIFKNAINIDDDSYVYYFNEIIKNTDILKNVNQIWIKKNIIEDKQHFVINHLITNNF